MTGSSRCRIVLLWHMHQPTYRSPLTGRYELPWVLLHGMRDYYDMPALAAGHEGVRPVFNLVPGMVKQLLDYAAGKADDVFVQVAMKDPADLSEAERLFLLDNFFVVHPGTMIRPYPRYSELMAKKQAAENSAGKASALSAGELRDLQVWYFLTWTGLTLRQDPRVSGLLAKGRDFSAGDKQDLMAAIRELLGGVVPLHRDLLAARSIDVSCSPMYHPILPLLVDTDSAQEAVPDIALPGSGYAYPADAHKQVEDGLALMSGLLKAPVRGMWPSEGSVSEPVLKLLNANGVDWIATDEKILFSSLPEASGSRQELLYTPWRSGDTAIFFRDQVLSDLPGFEYSRWEPEAAVGHFLAEIHKSATASGLASPVVTIAMDGENAWEYYVHGGMKFVDLLYSTLAADDRFEVVSPMDVLKSASELPELPQVAAGSWIDGDFRTWIGDPVKNRAWEHLSKVRGAVETHLRTETLEPADLRELNDLVMRAEASDWFWWYGEGHTSHHEGVFDLLFRSHLQAIYHKLGQTPPRALDRPVAGAASRPAEGPEWRHDPVQDRWVVIAAGRRRRPQDFQRAGRTADSAEKCPFCAGREEQTPPQIVAYGDDGRQDGADRWLVRVVANKFPALRVEGDLEPGGTKLFGRMRGLGAHEVIIETPEHGLTLGELPPQHIALVLRAYRDRILDLRQDQRMKYVLALKNNGREAGATLSHSHSQIMASPMIPRTVAAELASAAEYHGTNQTCLFCDLARAEIEAAKRAVLKDELFLTYCPYASRFPCEMRLQPIRHQHDFALQDDEALMALAQHLGQVLLRVNSALGEPPYNLVLHNAPGGERVDRHWHWHFELLPRFSIPAGFEWGTGSFVNPVSPEDAARHLRRQE